MRRLGALIVGIALASPMGASTLVNPTLNGPATVNAGQAFQLVLQVQNSGPGDLQNVRATLSEAPAGFVPVRQSGPLPLSHALLAGGDSVQFTWTYSGSGCGTAQFNAEVAADENGTPVPTVAPAGHTVALNCTPTPTPTPTPDYTATATPWIVYGTPTAVPSEGWAGIPGNLYHPLRDGDLQFQAMLPEAGKLKVELFDRLGRKVKALELDAGPGAASLSWDGRGDDGLMVSSGIYVARFTARGFSRNVKFAVIK
jgi:hypothetical protein